MEVSELPDMTITRIEGVYEPTLADVVKRIVRLSSFGSEYNNAVTLDIQTNAILR